MEKQQIINLFISGIFAILLPVIIINGKRGLKRKLKREELRKTMSDEEVEKWLNGTPGYEQTHFLTLLTKWSLQPLFIISMTNLIDHSGLLPVMVTFFLTLMIILHELWMSTRHSTKWWYQILMLLIWIVVFLLIYFQDYLTTQ